MERRGTTGDGCTNGQKKKGRALCVNILGSKQEIWRKNDDVVFLILLVESLKGVNMDKRRKD